MERIFDGSPRMTALCGVGKGAFRGVLTLYRGLSERRVGKALYAFAPRARPQAKASNRVGVSTRILRRMAASGTHSASDCSILA
jgi:hypothetical protein